MSLLLDGRIAFWLSNDDFGCRNDPYFYIRLEKHDLVLRCRGPLDSWNKQISHY